MRSDAASKRQLIRRSAQLELNAQIEEAKVKQGQRDDKLEALSNALKVEDERAAWLQRVADEFRSRAEAVKPTSCMAHGAAACMRPGPCPWTGSPRPSASGARGGAGGARQPRAARGFGETRVASIPAARESSELCVCVCACVTMCARETMRMH